MSESDWMREELGRLRAERDTAYRELSSMRTTLDELSRMIAKNNDQLDQVVTMLRRRETQLKRAERENRKLRKQLGLDPDPEPTSAPLPEEPSASDDDEPPRWRRWGTPTIRARRPRLPNRSLVLAPAVAAGHHPSTCPGIPNATRCASASCAAVAPCTATCWSPPSTPS